MLYVKNSFQWTLCVTTHLLVTVIISVVKYLHWSTKRLKNLPTLPWQKMEELEFNPRVVSPKSTPPCSLPWLLLVLVLLHLLLIWLFSHCFSAYCIAFYFITFIYCPTTCLRAPWGWFIYLFWPSSMPGQY